MLAGTPWSLKILLCFPNEEDHKIARYVAKSILWCLEGCSEKETCLANASLCCSPSERMPLQSAKWSRPLPGLLPLEVLPLSSSKPSLTCRNTLSKSLSLGSGFWLLLPFLWGRLMWVNQNLCTMMLSAFSSAVSDRHSSQEKYNGTAICTWVRNTWFSHIYASALRIRCNSPVLNTSYHHGKWGKVYLSTLGCSILDCSEEAVLESIASDQRGYRSCSLRVPNTT